MVGGCRIVLQGSGRSRGGWTSKVTGGKAAVSGLKSSHLRRQSHWSSYSSCKVALTNELTRALRLQGYQDTPGKITR